MINLTSIDPETGEVVELFSPRTLRWSDHFKLDGATIVGLTTTGRATARLLNMNAEEQIELRSGLIRRNEF